MNILKTSCFSFLYKLSRVGGKAVLVTLIILMLATPAGFTNQSAMAAPGKIVSQDEFVGKCLNANQVQTAKAADSDNLRFVGTEAGNPIAQPNALPENTSPEDAARAYLGTCGSLLGIKDVSAELATQRSNVLEDGRSVVRFQQNYQGVPVMAGEMIVQMDQQKNILAIVNKTTNVKIDSVTPSVDAETAYQDALQAVAKEYQLDESSLTATRPELWIYKPLLMNPADTGPTSLVWRLEVRADGAAVDELVLVDAQRGGIVLKFNQIDTNPVVGDGAGSAIAEAANAVIQDGTIDLSAPEVLGSPSIAIYTLNHATTGLPGTLVCTNANPAACASDADANAAYWFAYHTYLFYVNNHGRDSIDGLGMTMVSTVHFGSGFANAFWDGTQMVYGDGYSTAADVVAHELTHGVTNMESNLYYYYQSGAINESFSDVWGEFVEKTVYGDTDWLMGENLPIGAIRDMANPPAYSDPDKMSSGYYWTGSSDNGGVHTNSGISNKAAYLMTDGGVFNGYTVSGIGLAKVAKIYYEANTNLLTSGSDYYDLYVGLYQACINLSITGAGGITSANCTQVRYATEAVEMDHGQPYGGFNPNATVCDTGIPTYFYKDSFEGGAGLIVAESPVGTNWWYLLDGYYAHTGTKSMTVDGPATVSTSSIRTGNIYIPSGAYLHFDHAYNFETSYDGGIVEYSTNGGSTWTNGTSLFDITSGVRYNYTISTGYSNPIGGFSAFSGPSHGFVQSRMNLSSLAGQTVMFRWRQGSDSIGSSWGWVVDDINLYTCHTNTRALYDFSGDGTAEATIFRPSNGLWAINGLGYVVHGMAGDIPVPGDYNGDGMAETAIYRPSNGLWAISGLGYFVHGMAGDVPVPGDYNGDGKTDIAIYRPSNGLWAIYGLGYTVHGMAGDIPVPADYNADGRTDIAIFRPSNGLWVVKDQFYAVYGMNGDIPVPGDYNGGGAAELAIYRPSNGLWAISGMGYTVHGMAGDIPVPADYNGDGATDIAIFRPSNGLWAINGIGYVVHGMSGDWPIPARDTNGDGDPYQ